MWIATTRGFFSAVEHKTDPSLLVVRTRDHGDAETLRAWYEFWTDNGLLTGPLPPATITTYEHSDYPWRVIMPRAAWGEFLAEAVQALDYGNFKDAVKANQGPERAGVYLNVWSALLRLEYLDPHGRPEPVWDAEPWDDPLADLREDGSDTPDECPACEGVGETYSQHRDPAQVVPQECPVCNGDGYLRWAPTAAQVSAWLETRKGDDQ